MPTPSRTSTQLGLELKVLTAVPPPQRTTFAMEIICETWPRVRPLGAGSRRRSSIARCFSVGSSSRRFRCFLVAAVLLAQVHLGKERASREAMLGSAATRAPAFLVLSANQIE